MQIAVTTGLEISNLNVSVHYGSAWWVTDHCESLKACGVNVSSRLVENLLRLGKSEMVLARYADVRSSRVRNGPGIFQIENPLTRYQEMTPNKVILTDPIYFPYFPNAAEWRWAPERFVRLSGGTERDIDLLVVGSHRRAGNVSQQSREIAEAAINDFGGAPEVLKWPESVRCFLSLVARGEIDPREPTCPSIREDIVELQARLNLLRRLRREAIVSEICRVAKGNRVMVVGNLGEVVREIEKVRKVSNLKVVRPKNWSRICALGRRSKFLLVTNPALPNTLNERFRVALRTGSIPLVEPYAVYDDYAEACEQFPRFDYGGQPLADTFKKCLASESQLRESLGNFATRLRESEVDSYEAWAVETISRALRHQG